MMAIRKIALMHKLFGKRYGHACRECSNLVKGRYHDRILTKCKVYGLTHSEASDWAGKWQACGMFNQPWDKQPVIREVRPERKQKETDNTPLEGQMSLEV